MKIRSLFLILALTLSGCLDPAEDEQTNVIDNRYFNHTLGLSLQFPRNWRVEMNVPHFEDTVAVRADGPQGEEFPPLAALQYFEFDGPEDPRSLMGYYKAYLSEYIKDMQGYQESVFTQNGLELGRVQYSSSVHGTVRTYQEIFFVRRGYLVSVFMADKANRFDGKGEMTSIRESISMY